MKDIKNITSANIDVLRGGETRPTLSPALFVGKAARKYKIVQENRELIDSIYCYCNCKKSLGHKSLLSCFVDKHADNCAFCQNQALSAYALYQITLRNISLNILITSKFYIMAKQRNSLRLLLVFLK